MTPQELKNSILQLAIQGKLVEQRAEEGTAEELYRQIQAEKQALIKAGKIKKDRRTDSLEMSQDDEIPFDIPETWKWAYLGSILNKLTDGTHRTPKYSTSGVKFVSVKDMSSGILSLHNTKFITESEHEELYARCNPAKGDMLLSKVGTTGVPAIVMCEGGEPGRCAVWNDEEAIHFQKALHRIRLYGKLSSEFYQKLFFYFAKSGYLSSFFTGTTIKHLTGQALEKVVVPLPPLAEQKRIVAKLEELLPLCERLK